MMVSLVVDKLKGKWLGVYLITALIASREIAVPDDLTDNDCMLNTCKGVACSIHAIYTGFINMDLGFINNEEVCKQRADL